MRRPLIATALAAVAALMVACTPAGPATGTVVGKDYDRGRCTTKYSAGKPKSSTCKSDEYELDVRTDSGKVREVDVDPLTFSQVRIGDRWPQVAR